MNLAICVPLLASLLAASTSAGQDQWLRASPPTSPPGRTEHAMAYDTHRAVVVLFGGLKEGGGEAQDTWEWNGSTWTQRQPTTVPPARFGHALAYDTARKVCVLFGGGSGQSDTWEWDGTNWYQRNDSAGGRRYCAMAYDAARGRVVRFGGSETAETFVWDGKTWTLVMNGGPPARLQHAMAYDARRQRVVLSGGLQGSVALSDTWEWDGKTWQLMTPMTTQQPPRRGHTLTYVETAGKVILYGGAESGAARDPAQTWAWNGLDWVLRIPVSGPGEKRQAAAAYDAARQTLVFFGGWSNPLRFQETWLFTTKSRAPAAFVPFGSGCKGSAGTPGILLEDNRLPYVGEEMVARIAPLPQSWINVPVGWIGASRTSWLAIPLPLSLSPFGFTSCSLFVSIDVQLVLANQGGYSLWSLPVPFDQRLVGSKFFLQSLVFDLGANPGNAVFSDAAELTVGDR